MGVRVPPSLLISISMTKTIFVTYADDRFGRKDGKYAQTQRGIYEWLKRHHGFGISHQVHFGFDEWSRSDEFLNNQETQSLPDPADNGRTFKPWSIKQALDMINHGDFLIYNDCSPELWRCLGGSINPFTHSLGVLHGACMRNKGVLTSYVSVPGHPIPPENNEHTHKNYTLDLCMNTMGMIKYAKSFQHASGLVVLQKNQLSIDFVNEWLRWNLIPECSGLLSWHREGHVSEGRCHGGPKHGHRHDQSVSGLLINDINHDLILPRDMEYNFLSLCHIGHEYEFISSNYNNDNL